MSLQTRLFVGNIPEFLTLVDLRKAFSTYGDIVNLELKNKPGAENDKKFAFITLSAPNYQIESCIRDIAEQDFEGERLYVTRARESFLERLQRERVQARQLEEKKNRHTEHISEEKPLINLGPKLNPPKRIDISPNLEGNHQILTNLQNTKTKSQQHVNIFCENNENFGGDIKKINSEQKRIESLKRKRQDFKEKQMIIKTGLIGIDKVPNKKVIFSDNEENYETYIPKHDACRNVTDDKINGKHNLFDEEASDTEINFEIKKQFEGENGQKVLDLQSRFQSDKRFKIDERFLEETPNENEVKNVDEGGGVDIGQSDEKYKQMNILQDVLGVSIKMSNIVSVDRKKSKLGMLRYDPLHPDHQKFLAPVQNNLTVTTKKAKKKKSKDVAEEPAEPEMVIENIETSKEQFYKVTETLKEAMAQPNTFSLRKLFTNEDNDNLEQEQNPEYVELPKKQEKKPRKQLDTSGKNPFVYDSSDTEDEGKEISSKVINDTEKVSTLNSETKAVWRENLFFSPNDERLKEGLLFFTKFEEGERQKERRGLKAIMKKRMYNNERKNQIFQKKIGGRKKNMKKSITKRR